MNVYTECNAIPVLSRIGRNEIIFRTDFSILSFFMKCASRAMSKMQWNYCFVREIQRKINVNRKLCTIMEVIQRVFDKTIFEQLFSSINLEISSHFYLDYPIFLSADGTRHNAYMYVCVLCMGMHVLLLAE